MPGVWLFGCASFCHLQLNSVSKLGGANTRGFDRFAICSSTVLASLAVQTPEVCSHLCRCDEMNIHPCVSFCFFDHGPGFLLPYSFERSSFHGCHRPRRRPSVEAVSRHGESQGDEQQPRAKFFLIDREHCVELPVLIACKRTVVRVPHPKGRGVSELLRHAGTKSENRLRCFSHRDVEAWRHVQRRHAQRSGAQDSNEISPIFALSSVPAGQKTLCQDVLSQCASKHVTKKLLRRSMDLKIL